MKSTNASTVRRALAGVAVAALDVLSLHCAVAAQEPSPADLAKQTQNPVSSLISIPLQFNFNGGGGFGNATSIVLNIQPVVPVRVSERWNAIVRTIVPIVSLPDASGGHETGLGDIQEEIFFSPAKPAKLTWGIGPIFSFPTSTNALTRTGDWGIGPAAVAVMQPGSWVLGGLVTQVWGFAGDDAPPGLNQLLMQPFINYNFGTSGWALSSAPIITANWEAADGQEWTVPLGLGIARTTRFQRRPISIGAQYYYNVEHPDASSSWTLRFNLSLLYPPSPRPRTGQP